MKMTSGRRALDKIYKRRDRYEIPEWQREEVWDDPRKQELIDTVLRGWKLPKFYLVKLADDSYEVVDGQQRLSAIYEFFANELALSDESTALFGGPHYKDLKQRISDSFDDFEIEYDEIEDATEEELKEFFQRLQQGLPLTSSEKLNAVHSKLRDFCVDLVKRSFFKKTITVANTRYAHFDIASKAAAIEVEGLSAGLRYDDVKRTFEAQRSFSSTSVVAKRLRDAVDFLASAFPDSNPALKNRTIVQSVFTLACRLVETGNSKGIEKSFAKFVEEFLGELTRQVELGPAATDYDYIRFQKSINANVKVGARIRHEILLRKALMSDPSLANAFDPSALASSGIAGRVRELGDAISEQIGLLNSAYAAAHGQDLFKATNKTTQALINIRKPVKDYAGYSALLGDLYFLLKESVGQRLGTNWPTSFTDINTLRTDLQHDVDHGDKKAVVKKRLKIGSTFKKYSGVNAPKLLDAERFVLVQANLLSAVELDLKNLPIA
jgi:hypothetical protein